MAMAYTGCGAFDSANTQFHREVRPQHWGGVLRLSFRCISRCPGLTVIELLIVIALLSIVMMLGLPTFSQLMRFSYLQRDAWQLLADLRSYRHQAIVEHVNYRFVFDPHQNQYVVEQRDYVSGALLQPIKTVSFTNDLMHSAEVTFHPRGNASVAGELMLRDKRTSDTARIRVISTTGSAQITYQ